MMTVTALSGPSFMAFSTLRVRMVKKWAPASPGFTLARLLRNWVIAMFEPVTVSCMGWRSRTLDSSTAGPAGALVAAARAAGDPGAGLATGFGGTPGLPGAAAGAASAFADSTSSGVRLKDSREVTPEAMAVFSR